MEQDKQKIVIGESSQPTSCGPYPAPDCSALVIAVLECEQERVSAKMSGLETGWEHPNTQAMWNRVAKIAVAIYSQNPANEHRTTGQG